MILAVDQGSPLLVAQPPDWILQYPSLAAKLGWACERPDMYPLCFQWPAAGYFHVPGCLIPWTLLQFHWLPTHLVL